MPVGGVLEAVRAFSRRDSAEVIADQLQAHRQAVGAEAHRMRQSGQAGEVHRDGVDVRQVHLHGSSAFSPSAQAVVGVVGPAIRSQCCSAAWKSCAIRRRRRCGLQVVGVVVAVREHVGADQDAALDLGAEASARLFSVHVGEVAVFGGAVAVAHAVEA